MTEEVKIILQGEFKDGKLVVTQLKDIDNNLKKIEKSSAKTTQNIKGLGLGFKDLIKFSLLKRLTRSVINLGKSVIKTGSDFETFEITFTSFLGSTKEARNLIEELITFGRKTPFTITGLLESTKQMLSLGFEVEKIIPTLSMLGDVAGGIGVPVQQLVDIFARVKSNSRLMGIELNRFTRAGVPLLQVLAKNLGVLEEDILKLSRTGKIAFADVEDAFKTMTSEGGKFFGLINANAGSAKIIISNIGDAFVNASFRLSNILLPTFKKFGLLVINTLDTVTAKIQKNATEIEVFVDNLINGLRFIFINGIIPLLRGLKLLFTGFSFLVTIPVAKWFLIIGAAIKLMLSVFSPLTVALGAMVIAFDKFFGTLDKTKKSLASLKFLFLQAADSALALWEALNKDREPPAWITRLRENIQKLKDETIDAFNKIDDRIKKQEKGAGLGFDVKNFDKKTKELEEKLKVSEERQKQIRERNEAIRLGRAKKLNEELLGELDSFYLRSDEKRQTADQAELENKLLQNEKLVLAGEEFVERRRELDQRLLDDKISFQEFDQELDFLHVDAQSAALDMWHAEQLSKDDLSHKQRTKNKVEFEKRKEIITKDSNKIERILQDTRVQGALQTTNELVKLQESGSKELSAIGKAAALFQITNDTARGAMSAYVGMIQAFGPVIGQPLGIAAAAAVTAFGAEQLRNTAASFAVGTAEIPTDTLAQVHAGEMIVPATFAESIRSGNLTLGGGGDQSVGGGNQGSDSRQTVNVEINLTDRASELFTAQQFDNQQLGIDR